MDFKSLVRPFHYIFERGLILPERVKEKDNFSFGDGYYSTILEESAVSSLPVLFYLDIAPRYHHQDCDHTGVLWFEPQLNAT